MAEVSFVVSTIGLVIPFVVQEQGVPVSNALSAIVTWIAEDGRHRPLTLLTPTSAVFIYTLSAFAYQTPRHETGQLRVSYGTNEFWTVSMFSVRVIGHL